MFDTFVAVDWSARSVPARGADSIWVAVLDAGGEVSLGNPPTRRAAEEELAALVEARRERRTLIGIDVGLGYPAGTADLLGWSQAGGGAPWRAAWRALAAAIEDGPSNRNNRFEVAAALNRGSGAAAGPFWGCPPGVRAAGLTPTKPATSPLPELRVTESVLRAAGRRPMPVWQLTGAGSVGSQTLTALPVLERLVTAWGDRAHVWPFTTGLRAPEVSLGDVVVAEVWPTAFDPVLPPGVVRDAAQVRHVACELASASADGRLRAWFSPVVPAGAPVPVEQIVGEEGWVLGPCGP